jgi:hypothetical protein
MFLDPEFEACCYDIFEVDIKGLEIDLLAQTFNDVTKAAAGCKNYFSGCLKRSCFRSGNGSWFQRSPI